VHKQMPANLNEPKLRYKEELAKLPPKGCERLILSHTHYSLLWYQFSDKCILYFWFWPRILISVLKHLLIYFTLFNDELKTGACQMLCLVLKSSFCVAGYKTKKVCWKQLIHVSVSLCFKLLPSLDEIVNPINTFPRHSKKLPPDNQPQRGL